jgi:anti-sigma B factor antagonist
MFEITVEKQGTVHISGRLDASQIDVAESELATVLQSTVLDFTGLEYISSAGIGVILKTYKRLNDSGFSLRLVNMSQRIRNVFEYAGLDRVLTIE